MKNLDKVIVLDLETSGLDPACCAVLEIGAVSLLDEAKQFSIRTRLPFGANFTNEALDVNGLSLAEISDLRLPLPYEGLMAMYDFFGWEEFLYAGQNVGAFDLLHVRETMLAGRRQGFPGEWPRVRQRSLDMHSVAIAYAVRRQIPVDLMRLDSTMIYQMLGMPKEPTPHRALTGALMERRALRIMLGMEASFHD